MAAASEDDYRNAFEEILYEIQQLADNERYKRKLELALGDLEAEDTIANLNAAVEMGRRCLKSLKRRPGLGYQLVTWGLATAAIVVPMLRDTDEDTQNLREKCDQAQVFLVEGNQPSEAPRVHDVSAAGTITSGGDATPVDLDRLSTAMMNEDSGSASEADREIIQQAIDQSVPLEPATINVNPQPLDVGEDEAVPIEDLKALFSDEQTLEPPPVDAPASVGGFGRGAFGTGTPGGAVAAEAAGTDEGSLQESSEVERKIEAGREATERILDDIGDNPFPPQGVSRTPEGLVKVGDLPSDEVEAAEAVAELRLDEDAIEAARDERRATETLDPEA